MDATTIPRPFDPAEGFLRLTRMAQWIFDVASITLAVLLVLTIIVIAVDRGMLRVPFIERWIIRPVRRIRDPRPSPPDEGGQT